MQKLRFPFAAQQQKKNSCASSAHKSPFSCGSSPNWNVTKSPRKSSFARKKYPQKSPFSVKGIHSCYSGFMHGNGKKDPICRRLSKPTKYSNVACFGPKTKDGTRPMSCGEEMTADCYSGFMHGQGKKDPTCRRLSKPTKYSNTKCFGPKGKGGRRPTSCDLTNILTDKEINDLANKMCQFFKDFKNREDYVKYSPAEKYAILRKIYLKYIKLTTGDELKLLDKVKATCLKDLQLTPSQPNIIVEIAKLPAKKQLQELSKISPILINKINNAAEITNLITTSVTENTNDVDKKEKENNETSGSILSNNMSEKEIETLGNEICENFKKKKYSHLSTNERYSLLMKKNIINPHTNLKLTTEDEIKILAKLQTTCFKDLQLTPSQINILASWTKLPKNEQKQALEELVITQPVLMKNVKESVEVGNLLEKLYENKNTIAGVAIAAAATTGLLIYGKNKIEKAIKHAGRNMQINLWKNYGIQPILHEDDRIPPDPAINKIKRELNKYFGGNYVTSDVRESKKPTAPVKNEDEEEPWMKQY